ncbi:MAG: D-tyrosyl-tRNA(Tyr) deacylase [Ignavibacteria bacterium]|nr:D-tyrosyl-tRNA(Tyr) deacylase [Ignavibacteria bacterium]
MRAILQRVSSASVEVAGEIVGQIGTGLLVLLGVTHIDTESNARQLADKLIGLRIFSDSDGKMNFSVQDTKGALLVVSNFTLYADMNKGFRPNFLDAAKPELAEKLYNYFVEYIRLHSLVRVETGIFGAMMNVSLVNDGPVTMVLDR